MDLGGWPVIDWVVKRVSAASLVDEVVVAIPDTAEDDELAEHLGGQDCRLVRGSTEDVLSRFAKAAKEIGADPFVRITADCPFIEPGVVDRVVGAFHRGSVVDYCANTLIRSYPLGMDCEVLSGDALLTADQEAVSAVEREHVTPFIYQRPERFRLRNAEAPEWARHSRFRLTLDEVADLAVLRGIVSALRPDSPMDLKLKDVLEVLMHDEDLASLNAEVQHRHVAKPDGW